MEALTNLITQCLPSCFSEREKRKFLSQQVSPVSHSKHLLFILQNKRFLLKKKKLAEALPFYEENQARLKVKPMKNRSHY